MSKVEDDTVDNKAINNFANFFDDEVEASVKNSKDSLEDEKMSSDTISEEQINANDKGEPGQEEDKKPVKDKKEDVNETYETLKKSLADSKAWGHKRNFAYINAKKKITDFLAKLQENGAIYEEEAKEALSYFNVPEDVVSENIEENSSAKEQINPFISLKQSLDKEFNLFKKYSKLQEADEKYQAFFSFLPLHSSEEQEKIITYLQEEEPEVVIDQIISTGAELYEILYKGINKQGGILPYVKSLNHKIEKLEQKNKELEAELDNTTEKVYSRSINSKVSKIEQPAKNFNFNELFD